MGGASEDAARGIGPDGQEAAFLRAVADAPSGLVTDWFWEGGRGGFSGPAGESYRACSRAGLVSTHGDIVLLTEAGVSRLGLASYAARDPGTWGEDRAERFFLKGRCHALAIALAERLGGTLVVIASRGRPLHVFAEDGEGNPYDFDGATTRERMLADCGDRGARFVRLGDARGLERYVGGHDRLPAIDERDVDMARRYVDARPDKFAPVAMPAP